MMQALSIGFRPQCHEQFVHDASDCVLPHYRSKLYVPKIASPFTTPVIKGLTLLSVYVCNKTSMAKRPPDDPKVAALRAAGALHPRPQSVRDQAFVNDDDFFDSRDRVQVKYEMLRRHRVDGRPVSQVAETFGVSRQAFYVADQAFQEKGIPGLLPRSRGPRRNHKCTEEVLDFVERWHAGQDVRGRETPAEAVRRHFGITVHPRSLDRALARRKKKLATSRQSL